MTDAETPPAAWSADGISDPDYRATFAAVPAILGDWLAGHGGFTGKDILDFGCGHGTAALSLALHNPTARVVGIDIMPDVDECRQKAREQIGLEALPANLSLSRVEPGSLGDPQARYDLIYSWSVFEHVDQTLLPRVVDQLRRALKPSGLMLVQIAPLYYSSEGAHLMAWVPERWGHLTNQLNRYSDKLLRALHGDRAAYDRLFSTFATLNRITAPQLVALIKAGGFEILRDYRTRDEHELPAELLGVYHEDALRTNQIVLLARPAAAALAADRAAHPGPRQPWWREPLKRLRKANKTG
jgi:SAM-dependent methyltransferase